MSSEFLPIDRDREVRSLAAKASYKWLYSREQAVSPSTIGQSKGAPWTLLWNKSLDLPGLRTQSVGLALGFDGEGHVTVRGREQQDDNGEVYSPSDWSQGPLTWRQDSPAELDLVCNMPGLRRKKIASVMAADRSFEPLSVGQAEEWLIVAGGILLELPPRPDFSDSIE